MCSEPVKDKGKSSILFFVELCSSPPMGKLGQCVFSVRLFFRRTRVPRASSVFVLRYDSMHQGFPIGYGDWIMNFLGVWGSSRRSFLFWWLGTRKRVWEKKGGERWNFFDFFSSALLRKWAIVVSDSSENGFHHQTFNCCWFVDLHFKVANVVFPQLFRLSLCHSTQKGRVSL